MKNVVTYATLFLCLALLVVGFYYGMNLKSHIASNNARIEGLQTDLMKTTSLLEAVDIDASETKKNIQELTTLVEEQDRLIESLAQQVSQ